MWIAEYGVLSTPDGRAWALWAPEPGLAARVVIAGRLGQQARRGGVEVGNLAHNQIAGRAIQHSTQAVYGLGVNAFGAVAADLGKGAFGNAGHAGDLLGSEVAGLE